MEFLGYLVTGAAAGTLAGLFGVGGGLIIVPALVFAFTLLGLSPEYITHLAVGTSLATIIPTSLSSTFSHNKSGNVFWPGVKLLAPGIMLGAWLGVAIAVQLSSASLQLIIGIGAILIGFRLLLSKKEDKGGQGALPAPPLMLTGGTMIGLISAIFGIGGGSLTVPFLTRFGMGMKWAVGTSAACGVPIAVMGAVANIVLGDNIEGLPELSTGLVYWPAFAGIVLMSVPFARLGAKLAHQLPAKVLRRLFACLLFVVGLKFILGS
ncbi:sulfite exporter TauE/SafE family protein [Parendozoicomonas sp. Alg238-R29]|uniref:sulfite exporter TauE/SafE family protein n=1 Tax=Parendozoicomonas sp. Alg238-R29 TaxID=2993446 RepID=UPI00248DCB39|nr:sulfite exporter TauE/SafE family protein [Parendozoicomonas sp. Alg238-R29]